MSEAAAVGALWCMPGIWWLVFRRGWCSRKTRLTRTFLKWAILVSNQWPLPCEGSALPLS